MPFTRNQPDTVANPTYILQRQSAPTAGGDVVDAYEPASVVMSGTPTCLRRH